MIDIKIDYVRFGMESNRREIGRIEIINTGDHPARPFYGNYSVECNGKKFSIENFKRSRGVMNLLREVLNYTKEADWPHQSDAEKSGMANEYVSEFSGAMKKEGA